MIYTVKTMLATATVAVVLSACVKEKEQNPECGKWQVEINNPDAKVKVEGDKLIVDIENPVSAQDVRLIQYQDADVNSPDISMAVKIATFSWEGVDGGASRDAQISTAMAYKTSPDVLVAQAVYGADKSTYKVEGKEVFSRMQGNGRVPNELLFYLSGEEAAFERDARTFPVTMISAASKVVYLDFGINTSFTRQNPTQSIHVEIDLVIFEQYTGNQNPIVLVEGNNGRNYGFLYDSFNCNSLIR
jgi:hypothetical protein